MPDSLFNEFESDINSITLINKEYERKTKTLKLKYPLNDSAKIFNRLEQKTIFKKFSLFNQLKSLLYKNRNDSYSMMFKDNNLILRFFNLSEDIINEFKIKMET